MGWVGGGGRAAPYAPNKICILDITIILMYIRFYTRRGCE